MIAAGVTNSGQWFMPALSDCTLRWHHEPVALRALLIIYHKCDCIGADFAYDVMVEFAAMALVHVRAAGAGDNLVNACDLLVIIEMLVPGDVGGGLVVAQHLPQAVARLGEH